MSNTKQERRLQNYDRVTRAWSNNSQYLSKKCKRANSCETLIEKSDMYAIKVQELEALSKNSKPLENTDGHYQWI